MLRRSDNSSLLQTSIEVLGDLIQHHNRQRWKIQQHILDQIICILGDKPEYILASPSPMKKISGLTAYLKITCATLSMCARKIGFSYLMWPNTALTSRRVLRLQRVRSKFLNDRQPSLPHIIINPYAGKNPQAQYFMKEWKLQQTWLRRV